MCLEYNEKLTNELKNSFMENFVFYKAFVVRNDILCSYNTNHTWENIQNKKAIEIKSNRDNNIIIEEEKCITKGIYVLFSKEDTMEYIASFGIRPAFLILPVYCKKEDIVAVGYSYLWNSKVFKCAVFTKGIVDVSSYTTQNND